MSALDILKAAASVVDVFAGERGTKVSGWRGGGEISGGCRRDNTRMKPGYGRKSLNYPEWRFANSSFRKSTSSSYTMQFLADSFTGHYDRTWRTDDGQLLYGVDNEDGTTDWYDDYNNPEGTTDTPSEDEQDENDYRNDGYDSKCPYCRGTGYDPFDGGQCPECYGSGVR